MTRLILAVALVAALFPAAARSAENVVLVLDASGSMWGQINGRTKADIAKEAVRTLVDDWDSQNQLGLVAYGHRRKGDCADIETLIAPGPLDAKAFVSRVDGLKFLGMTPLSDAVIHAADALKASEQKATVILVSDGEETCSRDPCQVGRELESRGVDFTAHVVGFDVPNPAHQASLRCLAENTGGRYFNARDAGELERALDTLATVTTAPKLPPATATVAAPATVPITSPFDVTWTGPADDGDYVAVTLTTGGSTRELDWARTTEPKLRLTAPAAPGVYEIRYISPRRTPAVLGTAKLDVTDLSARIDAPATAPAGTTITLTATGPEGPNHWIGFAPKGSDISAYRAFARPTGATSTLTLATPGEPGEYELRYVLDEAARILVARPITITAAEASIDAPTRIEAGSDVGLTARGPEGDRHWIGFAPAGSPAASYVAYARPSGAVSELTLAAPTSPGKYELRYVLDESGPIVATVPVEVIDPEASIEAPASVAAGASVQVIARGPVAERHWIGFAPAGSGPGTYRDYDRPTGPVSELTLTAPNEPGAYEIRYVIEQPARVLVSRAITVTAAE